MKQTKEEIVSDLYSLRSGLSVISEKADDVRKLECDVQEIEDKIQHSNMLCRELNNESKTTKEQISIVNEQINKVEVHATRKYAYYSFSVLFGMGVVYGILCLYFL